MSRSGILISWWVARFVLGARSVCLRVCFYVYVSLGLVYDRKLNAQTNTSSQKNPLSSKSADFYVILPVLPTA